MDQFVFESGKPACPNACKYCFLTEHAYGHSFSNPQFLSGVNKSCTYINVPPWMDEDEGIQRRFLDFPWHILEGDVVGFTAITDPFWHRIDRWLWHFLEQASPLAKAVTCVTKWPISRSKMKRLAEYPNFLLQVGITGNRPPVEQFTVSEHLETLSLAKEYGVPALPVVHPYIAGVSDLSFLSDLHALGYTEVSVKGLLYCDATMRLWIPEETRQYYVGSEDRRVLPEDGWRERMAYEGLAVLPSPKPWYLRECLHREPHLSLPKATSLVDRVFELGNVTSSSATNDVRWAAIARRL